MKRGFWKRLLQRNPKKKFSAWQIELTTRCPLRCRMCPKEEGKGFVRRDMNLADYKKLLPYLQDVEAVILEGWGESLLHKDLFECIRLAKKEGPKVGFVTSGMGLNETYISDLIRAEVDFIGFSLSGATCKTHNSIRVNSDLQEILHHIRNFQEEKERQKRTLPKLHIVYLLLRNNIEEAPFLIQLVGELGIRELVLINITHVSNAWQDEQKVFGPSVPQEFEEILKEMEAMARARKIRLTRPSLSFSEVGICSENPLRNLYISTEGDVSPCVYLNPPLTSPFKRIFQGRDIHMEKVQFGNLFREDFQSIWKKPSYEEFRAQWQQREKQYKEFSASLWDPDKWKEASRVSLPQVPVPCQTCYKSLGV